MSWTIRQRIYIDVSQSGSGHLLELDADGVGQDRSRDWVHRLADCFDLEIVFLDRSQNPQAYAELTSGYEIVVAAKKATNGVPSGDVLFSSSGFAESTEGDHKVYTATLDTNTTEFSTAIGSNSEIDLLIDVEIQNAANTRRLTMTVPAKGRPQSYAGEGTPTPATPVYPSPSAIRTTDDMADGIVLTKGPGGECIITVDGIERGQI